MKTVHKTIALGDLVVAVFDEASHYSTDPREVSRLAAQTVTRILQRARGTDAAAPGHPPLNQAVPPAVHVG